MRRRERAGGSTPALVSPDRDHRRLALVLVGAFIRWIRRSRQAAADANSIGMHPCERRGARPPWRRTGEQPTRPHAWVRAVGARLCRPHWRPIRLANPMRPPRSPAERSLPDGRLIIRAMLGCSSRCGSNARRVLRRTPRVGRRSSRRCMSPSSTRRAAHESMRPTGNTAFLVVFALREKAARSLRNTTGAAGRGRGSQ